MSVKRECGTARPLAIERDQNACAQRRSRMDKRMLYGSEAAHLEQIFRGRIQLRELPGRGLMALRSSPAKSSRARSWPQQTRARHFLSRPGDGHMAEAEQDVVEGPPAREPAPPQSFDRLD